MAAREAHVDVLAAPLDRRDRVAFDLRRDEPGVVGPRQPRIVDAGGRDAPALDPRGETPALGLDLGKLRHR